MTLHGPKVHTSIPCPSDPHKSLIFGALDSLGLRSNLPSSFKSFRRSILQREREREIVREEIQVWCGLGGREEGLLYCFCLGAQGYQIFNHASHMTGHRTQEKGPTRGWLGGGVVTHKRVLKSKPNYYSCHCHHQGSWISRISRISTNKIML